MKIVFLSFADSRFHRAAARLREQAERMSFFDDIRIFDEHDLDANFCERFGDKLRRGVRGFGYWVWKPYLIACALADQKDGDLLFYCDIGCHLNPKGKWRLNYYAARLRDSDSGVMGFHLDMIRSEYRWTKGDLFDYYGVRGDDNITLTPQICSTHAFFRKGEKASDFLKEWQKPYYENFSLVDDTPSRSPNGKGFVEHRHDQSVFSLLCKLKEAELLCGQETYAEDWSVLDKFPIQDRRDRLR